MHGLTQDVSAAPGSAPDMGEIMQAIANTKAVALLGGSGKASCGSGAGQGDLPTEIWEKVKNHPCYSEEAHHHYARMHVAVAPACNIQCNYCNRKYDCANESRPGVVSEKLSPSRRPRRCWRWPPPSPDDGARHRRPGRPVANPEKPQDLRAVDLISKTAPDIKLCLSTNGLTLPDHVDTIASYNVDHVTITINMVDPRSARRSTPGSSTSTSATPASTRPRSSPIASCSVSRCSPPRHPHQDQLGDDHGINDQHLVECEQGGEVARRLPAHIHAPHLRPEHGTVFGLNGSAARPPRS